MFGVDKVIAPIGYEMISTIGYNPLTTVLGFISNISIGGSALALASTIKSNKEKRGMVGSFGITALCGITEPAFYGALIIRPKALIGTAIGAGAAGLIAGIFGLRTFIAGGISGYFTLLAFIDPNDALRDPHLANPCGRGEDDLLRNRRDAVHRIESGVLRATKDDVLRV